MAVDPPLTTLFGAGATQDATTLTIQKSSLPGLTPTASDNSEKLLVGLLRRWILGQDTSTDAQVVVRRQLGGVVERNGPKQRFTYVIDLYAPYQGDTEPDPDDF